MIQVSNASRYAIRAMVDISTNSGEGLVTIQEIAKRQDIPQTFLTKIVQHLSRAGLVRAYRGAVGGIALVRPADQINLRQIMEAVQGPIFLAECLIQPSECSRLETCSLHGVLMEMQNSVVKILEDTNLASLVSGYKRLAARQRR